METETVSIVSVGIQHCMREEQLVPEMVRLVQELNRNWLFEEEGITVWAKFCGDGRCHLILADEGTESLESLFAEFFRMGDDSGFLCISHKQFIEDLNMFFEYISLEDGTAYAEWVPATYLEATRLFAGAVVIYWTPKKQEVT